MTQHAPVAAGKRVTGLYQGASGHAYHDGKRALNPRAAEWVFRLRAGKLQPWIGDTDVVFELGVGSGWNLARVHCARRLGCDASDFLADRLAELGIEFHAASANIPDAVADVAICHHALEHFLDPPAALRELGRILRPEGRLVVHVPWETGGRHACYRADDPNHHLYHWNPQNLGNLVSVLGWRIESIRARRYGYDRFAANLSARLRLGEAGFRTLRTLLILLRPLREVELVARR